MFEISTNVSLVLIGTITFCSHNTIAHHHLRFLHSSWGKLLWDCRAIVPWRSDCIGLEISRRWQRWQLISCICCTLPELRNGWRWSGGVANSTIFASGEVTPSNTCCERPCTDGYIGRLQWRYWSWCQQQSRMISVEPNSVPCFIVLYETRGSRNTEYSTFAFFPARCDTTSGYNRPPYCLVKW